jgi:hypothetical protein
MNKVDYEPLINYVVEILWFILRAFLLMYGWNIVMPYILELPRINLAQAMWLLVMVLILGLSWHKKEK